MLLVLFAEIFGSNASLEQKQKLCWRIWRITAAEVRAGSHEQQALLELPQEIRDPPANRTDDPIQADTAELLVCLSW